MVHCKLRPHRYRNRYVLATEPQTVVRRHIAYHQDRTVVNSIPDGYSRGGG